MRIHLGIVAALAAPLPILALAAAPASAASTPRVALHGDVAPAVSHSTRTGTVASNKHMSVAVSLAPRDDTALKSFIAQVNDHSSKLFHHFLTPAEFASRFGPTTATINQVTSYLRGAGLSVGKVEGGHLVVDASGTASQVAKAFGTQIGTYYDKQTKRSYFANTTAPTLPSNIAHAVVAVAGLENYATAHDHVKALAKRQPHAPVGGYGPAQITGAYNLKSALSSGDNGSGKTVALAEFDGFQQTNITTYDNQYGISTTAPKKVAVDGGSGSLGGGQIEVELDIEVVQAIAPGATIDVYEAPNSDQGEIDLYNSIVSADTSAVSSSWGIDEGDEPSANMTADDNEFQQAASQGQSVFAASGDNGSDDAGNGGTSVDFPASDPYVSGAGGTTLTVTSSNGYGGETAWSGSGGGESSNFSTPSYQTAVNSTGSREVPDVAADADPNTGWSIYSAGAWQQVGGTSAAAPNWAAFTAIFDQAKGSLGFVNQTIYPVGEGSSYSSAFHDITSGSNGAYNAGRGYDPVTGWGSYNGANFISDVS